MAFQRVTEYGRSDVTYVCKNKKGDCRERLMQEWREEIQNASPPETPKVRSKKRKKTHKSSRSTVNKE